MFNFTPMMTRSALAKGLGFLVGLFGFFGTRVISPNADPLFAWGIFALFISIGGIVGVIGIIKRIPLLNVPLPPVLRGGAMGAWFTFLCVIFGYDMINVAMQDISYLPDFMRNPFWMVLDGFFLGAAIDMIVSRVVKDVPDLFNA